MPHCWPRRPCGGWREGDGQLSLTDSQRLALAYPRHRCYIANQDYCHLTGVDSRIATRELAELVEQGLVERHGSRRWATYALVDGPDPAEVGEPTRVRRPSSARRQTAILPKPERFSGRPLVADRVRARLQASGDLSVQELARLTGASPASVRLALRRFLEEGLVQATGGALKSPRRRYRWTGPGSQRQLPPESPGQSDGL